MQDILNNRNHIRTSVIPQWNACVLFERIVAEMRQGKVWRIFFLFLTSFVLDRQYLIVWRCKTAKTVFPSFFFYLLKESYIINIEKVE